MKSSFTVEISRDAEIFFEDLEELILAGFKIQRFDGLLSAKGQATITLDTKNDVTILDITPQ